MGAQGTAGHGNQTGASSTRCSSRGLENMTRLTSGVRRSMASRILPVPDVPS